MPNPLQSLIRPANQLIDALWHICLLRSGPERLPRAPAFLALVLVASITVNLAIALGLPDRLSVLQRLTIILMELGLSLTFIILLMAIKNVLHRLPQTLSALLGTALLLQLVILPIDILLRQLPDGADTIKTICNYLVLIWIIWLIVVAGFILHRACNISRLLGSMYFLSLRLLFVLLVELRFPPPGA